MARLYAEEDFPLPTVKEIRRLGHGVLTVHVGWEGTMVSSTEESVSNSLRAVLADLSVGASIGDSEQFREVLSGLQFFLPDQVLCEIYSDWDHEDLDGIMPVLARK